MTRHRAWALAGLVLVLLAGVVVALLQMSGIVEDPARLVCEIAARRAGCD